MSPGPPATRLGHGQAARRALCQMLADECQELPAELVRTRARRRRHRRRSPSGRAAGRGHARVVPRVRPSPPRSDSCRPEGRRWPRRADGLRPRRSHGSWRTRARRRWRRRPRAPGRSDRDRLRREEQVADDLAADADSDRDRLGITPASAPAPGSTRRRQSSPPSGDAPAMTRRMWSWITTRRPRSAARTSAIPAGPASSSTCSASRCWTASERLRSAFVSASSWPRWTSFSNRRAWSIAIAAWAANAASRSASSAPNRCPPRVAWRFKAPIASPRKISGAQMTDPKA